MSLGIAGCSASSSSSETPAASLPVSTKSLLGYCARAPTTLKAAGFANEKALVNFLKANRISLVNDIDAKYTIQFGYELSRFPKALRDYLAKEKTDFHILQGFGVTEDPTFNPNPPTTEDGRLWSSIPGVGTDPTRIVVNRLYEGHGSINLVLHERAHTLDFHGNKNVYVSDSVEWRNVMAKDKAFMSLITNVCGSYCAQSPSEAFAEGFAMYFACDKSKALLKNAKLLNAFMTKISSQSGFQKIK